MSRQVVSDYQLVDPLDARRRLSENVVVKAYGGGVFTPPSENVVVVIRSTEALTALSTHSEAIRKNVAGIRLEGVAINFSVAMALCEFTRDPTAGLTLDVIDMRGASLDLDDLLWVYRAVGSSCHLMIDDDAKLLIGGELILGEHSLRRHNMPDLLAFIRRVVYCTPDQQTQWQTRIHSMDMSNCSAQVVSFGLPGQPKLLPRRLKKLSLAGLKQENFVAPSISELHSLPLEELNLAGCGIVFNTAKHLLSIHTLQQLNLSGNPISRVAFIQLCVQLPAADGSLVLDDKSLGIKYDVEVLSDQQRALEIQDRNFKGGVSALRRFAQLCHTVIMAPAGVAEAKAEALPGRDGSVLFALNRYCDALPSTIHRHELISDRKTFRLAKGSAYRNLPYHALVTVPLHVVADAKKLFTDAPCLQGSRANDTLEALLAARCLATSRCIIGFDASTKPGPLDSKGTALSVFKDCVRRLATELPKIQSSYQHYQKKFRGNPGTVVHAQLNYSRQAYVGALSLQSICRAVCERAARDGLVDAATMSVNVEDMQAMVAVLSAADLSVAEGVVHTTGGAHAGYVRLT